MHIHVQTHRHTCMTVHTRICTRSLAQTPQAFLPPEQSPGLLYSGSLDAPHRLTHLHPLLCCPRGLPCRQQPSSARSLFSWHPSKSGPGLSLIAIGSVFGAKCCPQCSSATGEMGTSRGVATSGIPQSLAGLHWAGLGLQEPLALLQEGAPVSGFAL